MPPARTGMTNQFSHPNLDPIRPRALREAISQERGVLVPRPQNALLRSWWLQQYCCTRSCCRCTAETERLNALLAGERMTDSPLMRQCRWYKKSPNRMEDDGYDFDRKVLCLLPAGTYGGFRSRNYESMHVHPGALTPSRAYQGTMTTRGLGDPLGKDRTSYCGQRPNQ